MVARGVLDPRADAPWLRPAAPSGAFSRAFRHSFNGIVLKLVPFVASTEAIADQLTSAWRADARSRLGGLALAGEGAFEALRAAHMIVATSLTAAPAAPNNALLAGRRSARRRSCGVSRPPQKTHQTEAVMLGICLTVGLVIAGQAQTPEKDAKIRPWAVIAKRHAMAAKVYPTADPDHPFAALKEPVLHRMQEVTGSSRGSVFVWVEPSGRPAAICDVFLFEDGPGRYRLNNEWDSLAASPLRAESSLGVLFNATGPGLEWKSIPNAPAPADTPPGRDRQARRLADRFSADLVNRKNARFHLRLLTTPLHRHDTIDSPDSRGGALFAFCQQTDPELLLLIEARKSGAGYRWEYAIAGFSDMDLYLRLDGREVSRDVPAFSSGRGVHSGGRVRVVDTAAELEAAKREKPEE